MVKTQTLRQRSKEKFNSFLARHSWRGIAAFVFYPFITIVTMPIRFWQTLWNCRVLADGKNWGDYPNFNPKSASNSLFYWTRASTLRRFGRSGKVQNLGLGDFKLSGYFHYSLLSLYAYWKAGSVTLILGMFGWWSGHLLWLDQTGVSFAWLVAIMTVSLFCTTFYSNIFGKQNYNVLGWMFLPIVLYAWYNELWVLAGLAILFSSFCSITVVFITYWLAMFYSIQVWSVTPVLTLIPSCIKICTHFYPYFLNGGLKNYLRVVAKAIGLKNKSSKYVRHLRMRFTTMHVYRLLIYSQFAVVLTVHSKSLPLLVLISVIAWIINSRLLRFGDEQSLQMLIFSTATAAIIRADVSLWLLASFWILASPIPYFSGLPGQKSLLLVPILRPLNIRPLLNEMIKFLSPVQSRERILMAFEDPQGEYSNLFDGYRALVELPLYVSSERNIHFIPNWHAIFELNYEGAPDFWGREVHDVERQMEAWEADYVIVYQRSGTELEKKWATAGFKEVSHFPWGKYDKYFEDIKPYRGYTPDWWLLKK